MFDTTIRLRLCQGVLLGEKDAHQVLGDLLEENGEEALAQWARREKNGVFRKLDFVLAVLPYRLTLCLGCDFLASASAAYAVATHVSPMLKQIRDWVLLTEAEEGESDPAARLEDLDFDLATAIRKTGFIEPDVQLSNYDGALMAVEDCIRLFENAVSWAERTMLAEIESDHSGQIQGGREVVNHVRRMRGCMQGYRSGVSIFGANRKRPNQHPWWVLSEYNEADFNPVLIEFPHWELHHAHRWISKMLESPDGSF